MGESARLAGPVQPGAKASRANPFGRRQPVNARKVIFE
jgi:hypothetical protein